MQAPLFPSQWYKEQEITVDPWEFVLNGIKVYSILLYGGANPGKKDFSEHTALRALNQSGALKFGGN